MVNSDCALDRACQNQKCIDPCPGTCGINAQCKVVLHSPICSCPPELTGDPFRQCIQEESKNLSSSFNGIIFNLLFVERPIPTPIENPCIPSPCGLFSECRVIENRPVCSCKENYYGQPPYCRPECTVNSECPQTKACMNQKCKDPCPGSCGYNAECRTINHAPVCYCLPGYSGDPFSGCQECKEYIIVAIKRKKLNSKLFLVKPPQEPAHPCNPSPCGTNAICRELNGAGSCTCLPTFYGDPYSGCRPECVVNSDCPKIKSCRNNKCVDPCPGICGINAECSVINHSPTCVCLPGFTGNPSKSCHQPVITGKFLFDVFS